MNIQQQIIDYINSQPQAKQQDLRILDDLCRSILPAGPLWFLDGKDDQQRIIANPNIGYGIYTIHYANGTSKPFYQIGLSANKSGISAYIMGIGDKLWLPNRCADRIGKATVTGYCIRFNAIRDINLNVLEEAMRASLPLSAPDLHGG